MEVLSRIVDSVNNEISIPCSYPDSSRMRKGFNPIIYPDLQLKYNVRVKAEGKSFTIIVDLEKPVPAEWIGRVGYNLGIISRRSLRENIFHGCQQRNISATGKRTDLF